jgi:hypothetical protein
MAALSCCIPLAENAQPHSQERVRKGVLWFIAELRSLPCRFDPPGKASYDESRLFTGRSDPADSAPERPAERGNLEGIR